MPAPYTLQQLTDVEDSAPKFGFEGMGEARFAKGDLETEQTGVSYLRLNPNKRQPFAHKHENAEEVYAVISGSGRLKLDDDIIDVKQLDAIRVAATVTRAFEAGPDGLEILAFGARHDGDGEVIQGWWSD